MKTRLSVNINKVAWLRNARGGNLPNVTQVAIDCERFGADGITIHPRPDERHITRQDVYELKEAVSTEYNIEGYPSPDFLNLISEIKPEQVTIVPDAPDVLTSNSGWDVVNNKSFLKEISMQLKTTGARLSVFVEPSETNVEAAKEVGADRIEFYTGHYARGYNVDKVNAIEPYVKAANFAHSIGMGINAGHDLSLDNLAYFDQNLTELDEVSIGHALISDALYYGLENTIMMYQKCLSKVQSSSYIN